MGKPIHGRFYRPLSLEHMERACVGDKELRGFLLPFARQRFVYKEWDFCETAITDDPNAMWAAANSGGTSAADFVTLANDENGAIIGDTGTDDDGGVSLYLDSVMLEATKNPGLHVIMKIDDVSEAALEIAMTDAPTDPNTVTVTDYDSPAVGNGVTDGVILGYDTDTTTQKGFSVIGVGTSTAVAAAAIGAATAADPIEDATYFDAIIQAFAGQAYAILKHRPDWAKSIESGPDTGRLMRPSIMCQTRNTTAKFPRIDLIRLWFER